MRRLVLTLLAGAALASAAVAQPPISPPMSPAAGNACFFTRDIANHSIADGKTLYLNVRGNQTYVIAMRGNCLGGAMSSDPIIIRNSLPSMRVCTPLDLDIGVRGARCMVEAIRKLSPAEVDAIPRRLRP